MAEGKISWGQLWAGVGALAAVITVAGGLLAYVIDLQIDPIDENIKDMKADLAELRGVDAKTGEKYALTETDLRTLIASLAKTQEGHGRDIIHIKEGLDGIKITLTRMEEGIRMMRGSPIKFEVLTEPASAGVQTGATPIGDYKKWVEEAIKATEARKEPILVLPVETGRGQPK